jgi:hypothetical protein
MGKAIIEQLNPNIAQFSDWKFNEIVIEKINEMIGQINRQTEMIDEIGTVVESLAEEKENKTEEKKTPPEVITPPVSPESTGGGAPDQYV